MAIENLIPPRTHNLGGDFVVRRILPYRARRSVGPFVFFDHFGPTTYAPGNSFDVRPHPHIGLSTVTYLFEGAIRHRDSLGTDLVVEPGAVNWMTAGHGIVHSERTPDLQQRAGQRLHGIQTWVALPVEEEDCAPQFVHHPAESLPLFDLGDVSIKLLAGAAWGHSSPVSFPSDILYLTITAHQDCAISLPSDLATERALYLVSGSAFVDDTQLQAQDMAVLESGLDVSVNLEKDSIAILCGGAPLDAPRKMDWNFVSSDAAKITTAREDWTTAIREGGTQRFPAVPGDESEWIPLPHR